MVILLKDFDAFQKGDISWYAEVYLYKMPFGGMERIWIICKRGGKHL